MEIVKKRDGDGELVLGGIKETNPKKKRSEEEGKRIKDKSYLVGCDAHKAEGQDPWCLVLRRRSRGRTIHTHPIPMMSACIQPHSFNSWPPEFNS